MTIAAALGTIGSYADSRSKKYLGNATDLIEFLMSPLNDNIVMPFVLKDFCVRLNAMQLSFTRTEVGLLGEVGLDFGVLKGKLKAIRKKYG